jgi:hypothetical protein
MKHTFIIISFCFLVILSGCDKCKEKTMSAKHFESEYGCADTKHTLIIDLTDAGMIIRSKEEFDSKVSGICHPDIDFALYDLVIGKQSTANEVDTILYEFGTTCPDDELTLSVDIVQSLITTPDNIVYHALVPKLGDEQGLLVNITVR